MNSRVHCAVLFALAQCQLVLSCTGLRGSASLPVGVPSFGGGESHREGCLHLDGVVATTASANETRKVHELEVGDRVLAYTNERGFHWSPVVTVLHRDLVRVRDFVRFVTAGGKNVALTTDHGVHTGRCGHDDWTEKRADELTLDECVKTASGQDDRLVQITLFKDAGAVQPITEAGFIVVNDVVLSCYDYENEKRKRNKKTNPHDRLEPHRLLYSLGENLYERLQESRFAGGVLEMLIRSTGLEKLYVA